MYCLESTSKYSVYKNYQILSLHFSSVSQYKDFKNYAHIFPVLSPGAISDVVFYLDIMDLHIYSLGTWYLYVCFMQQCVRFTEV